MLTAAKGGSPRILSVPGTMCWRALLTRLGSNASGILSRTTALATAKLDCLELRVYVHRACPSCAGAALMLADSARVVVFVHMATENHVRLEGFPINRRQGWSGA